MDLKSDQVVSGFVIRPHGTLSRVRTFARLLLNTRADL
jgi:hypothetical protein